MARARQIVGCAQAAGWGSCGGLHPPVARLGWPGSDRSCASPAAACSMDIMHGQLHAQGAGQPHHACFGRGIAGDVGWAEQGIHGADVNDLAAPPPPVTMALAADRAHKNEPVRCVSTIARQSSVGISNTLPRRAIPCC